MSAGIDQRVCVMITAGLLAQSGVPTRGTAQVTTHLSTVTVTVTTAESPDVRR